MKITQIVLLITAVAAGFVMPDFISSLTQNTQPVNFDKYCLLSTTPCQQDGVSMSIEHDIVKSLVPSRIDVNWGNTSSETLLLSLHGLEMNMGIAKYQLTKQPNGKYSTTVLLPVCTQNNMTWIGTLSDGSKKIYTAIRMER